MYRLNVLGLSYSVLVILTTPYQLYNSMAMCSFVGAGLQLWPDMTFDPECCVHVYHSNTASVKCVLPVSC